MKSIAKFFVVSVMTIFAKIALIKYKPKIVAIAGSVGKTSTKDAIFTVLKSGTSARKSEKSYNGDIGIPLSIFGLENAWMNPLKWARNFLLAFLALISDEPFPHILVLEIGADRPGNIWRIMRWLKPDISVITRFGNLPVHIEFFKDKYELIEEDGNVARALPKKGLLVANIDDADSMSMKEKTEARFSTYGFDKNGTIVASNTQIVYDDGGFPTGMTYKIEYEGKSMPVRLFGSLGNVSVYATLPALLVGKELGINIVQGIEALSKHVPPPGRLRILKGVKNSAIIDDTYNSSPIAAEEALRVLKELNVTGKKIAILGDMLELGKKSEEAHKAVGERAAVTCDILVTVGIRSRKIAEGALIGSLSEKNIFQFEDSRKAGKFVEGIIKKGDAILIKGSQSMRMERAVEEIMAEPLRKEELLVRQDREWQSR
ncbi:MAG: UDP-N-acetylmuramoyl-tripeptide--D-alanyl-D-alanine ligase [Patescibacteria group bacterium]